MFDNNLFSKEVKMIQPKTMAGQNLYNQFCDKINGLTGAFPRQGPKSKGAKIRALKIEYNTLLAAIEPVNPDEARPQMIEAISPAAKAYRLKMEAKIADIRKSSYAFAKSNPPEAQVDEVIMEYNANVGQYE